MKDLFGLEEKSPKTWTPKPHPRLTELRNIKKELKRERQRAIRTYGKGSHIEKVISEKWFKVMHEHTSLRRELEKRDTNRFNSKQQRRFKKDPFKFGKSVFEKKSTGDPSFGADQAFNYFSNICRDEKREEPVHQLPEMTLPPEPKVLFSKEPPSTNEISGILRKKSNGSAPGLDGIPYVPFKRCPSILPVLTRLQKFGLFKIFPPPGRLLTFVFLLSPQSLTSLLTFARLLYLIQWERSFLASLLNDLKSS